MLILSLLVIGPLLHALENVLLVIVEYALGLPLGIGGLIVGFFWSIITLTGVHHIFNMLEISLLASTGFNPFNAILCMCGFSSAGVCLAISVKARKKRDPCYRSQCYGICSAGHRRTRIVRCYPPLRHEAVSA